MSTALVRAEPQRRTAPIWMIVAAVGVASAILIAGYFYFFRQEYALLYRDLRPAAAASIVEELKKQRIPYRLANGGAEILVPTTDISSVRLTVAGADLPVGGLNGFELFDNSDMGLTDFAQKIKFQRALQGELTRTILLINGVADARVHLSLPEKSLFRNEAAIPKASVTLITKTSEPLAKAEIEGIQQLVASAIPDLQGQDVVVLNGQGKVVSERSPLPQPASPPTATAATQAAQAGESKTAEARLEALLMQALPNTQFRLRIEEVQPPENAQPETVADAAAGSDAPKQQILPPLPRVAITADRTLSPEEQKLIAGTIERAGVAAGAPLSFSEGLIAKPQTEAPVAEAPSLVEPAAPLPVELAAPLGPQPAAASLASVPAPSAILTVAGLVAAIGLVIALGVLLARRTSGAAPLLTTEDQSRFAERLRSGLAGHEQGAPHAT
jgi:flagellar M-ring protein FliF